MSGCDGWRRSRERQTNLSRSPGCYLRIWCFAVFICWCICNRIECHCGCCFSHAAACQNMLVSAVSVRVTNEICPRHPDPCASTRSQRTVISLRAWAGRDAAIRLAVGLEGRQEGAESEVNPLLWRTQCWMREFESASPPLEVTRPSVSVFTPHHQPTTCLYFLDTLRTRNTMFWWSWII